MKKLYHLSKRSITLEEVKNIELFGSSLGGLMATLGIYMYPDTFDMALAFSPTYQLYKEAIGVDDVYEK